MFDAEGRTYPWPEAAAITARGPVGASRSAERASLQSARTALEFGVCSAWHLHYVTALTGARATDDGAPRLDSTEEHDMAKQNDNTDRSQTDGIQKNPDEWVTGDESMTGPQASYLKTLATEAGEEVDEDLTKAEASKKIDELQERTGRGRDH